MLIAARLVSVNCAFATTQSRRTLPASTDWRLKMKLNGVYLTGKKEREVSKGGGSTPPEKKEG